MKYQNYALIALAAVLTASCNKEKAAIEESKDATQNAIEIRKDEINADAKSAIKRTEANADIDKANIEADKESMKAQLDADKKKADADADAAKAKVDAEN
jgi:PBP1b-binding outer membrane lipoprotein LpoB